MLRADSLEKTLMLTKIEGRRNRWQRMTWFNSITDSVNVSQNNSGNQCRAEESGVLQSVRLQESDTTEQLNSNSLFSTCEKLGKVVSRQSNTTL